MGPDPRISSGPAVIRAAPTGRTYDCTRPSCRTAHKTLAQRGRPHMTEPANGLVPNGNWSSPGAGRWALRPFWDLWSPGLRTDARRAGLGIKRTAVSLLSWYGAPGHG